MIGTVAAESFILSRGKFKPCPNVTAFDPPERADIFVRSSWKNLGIEKRCPHFIGSLAGMVFEGVTRISASAISNSILGEDCLPKEVIIALMFWLSVSEKNLADVSTIFPNESFPSEKS